MEKLIDFKKDWLEKEITNFVTTNTLCVGSSDLKRQVLRAIKISAPWREKSYLMINIANDFNISSKSITPLLISSELLMIAALTADDIFDKSIERENKKTIFSTKGPNLSFLIAETIYSLAIISLNNFVISKNKIPNKAKQIIFNNFLKAYQGIQLAQYWRSNQNLNSIQKMSIAKIKGFYNLGVGLLFSATLSSPAYISGNKNKAIMLERIGEKLGLALQISNDISDFDWDKKDLGRSGLEDLKNIQPNITLSLFLKKETELKSKKIIQRFINLQDNHQEIKIIFKKSGAIDKSKIVLKKTVSEIKNKIEELSVQESKMAICHILELL